MPIIIESRSLDDFLKSTYAIDVDKELASQAINQQAISNAIDNIIGTEYRERIFNPTFGSPLNALIFENPNENQIRSIIENLIQKIETLEPRVSILKSQVSVKVKIEQRSIDLEFPYNTVFGSNLETYSTRILF